jgi:hypothetical protein
MGSDGPRRRRHRYRAADPAVQPATAEPADKAPTASVRKRTGRDAGERGLRDLVGAGRSQLGVSGALRARDVNRPTDDDLADAERDVAIVRRHWKPHD